MPGWRFQVVRWVAVLAPLAVSGCGGSPQNALSDLAQPDAAKTTIVLSVTRPAWASALMLAPYDPVKHDTVAGFMGGYVSLNLGLVSDRGYIWKRVRPGTYVLHSFLQQGIWDLCFAANTQAFTAGAGQIVYLGRFDPDPYARALLQAVQAADQTKVRVPRSGRVISYMDAAPPAMLMADSESVAETHSIAVSQSYVATNVSAASFMPAAFEPGTDFLGESGSLASATCFGANPGLDVKSAE
jgi:hypothetical protein